MQEISEDDLREITFDGLRKSRIIDGYFLRFEKT